MLKFIQRTRLVAKLNRREEEFFVVEPGDIGSDWERNGSDHQLCAKWLTLATQSDLILTV